jgi:ubiquinone/menaquinone biosynthesis C-methylase UbiE
VRNPWLDVPLSDYEGHMRLPQVAQAQLLADVFEDQLAIHKPRSLAVLGCAGGNGFDRIVAEVTRRVVGVDLNRQYLNEVRDRFAEKFEQMELVEGDIQSNVPGLLRDELADRGVDLLRLSAI